MWVRGRLSHRASRRQAGLTEDHCPALLWSPKQQPPPAGRQPVEYWPLCSVVGIPHATQHPLRLTGIPRGLQWRLSEQETDCALLIPMG